MNIRFDGKVVAVTGAGHGFGRAIAQSFSQLGARVFATDLVSRRTGGDRRGWHHRHAGRRSARPRRGRRLDRRDREQTGGAIDVLVNDAGGVAGQEFNRSRTCRTQTGTSSSTSTSMPPSSLCRAAAPGMKRAGGGRIVNISSGAGLQPSLTGVQAYCSAKHAVVGLTRQLAHELGRSASR